MFPNRPASRVCRAHSATTCLSCHLDCVFTNKNISMTNQIYFENKSNCSSNHRKPQGHVFCVTSTIMVTCCLCMQCYNDTEMGFRGKIRLFRVLSCMESLHFTFYAGSFVSPSALAREEEDVRRHRRRGSGYMTEMVFKSRGALQVSFEVWRVKMTSDGWHVAYQYMQLE